MGGKIKFYFYGVRSRWKNFMKIPILKRLK